MNAHDLVGTWFLISFVVRRTDGSEIREPWGPTPTGRLIYTAEGHVAAVLTKPDRRRFVSADPTGGAPEEIKEAFEGLEAYAGRYEFDESTSTVRHYTDVARLPSWQGGSVERFVILQGNELTLYTEPMMIRGVEVVLTLVWRRGLD
ncbi:lipocalin-like domain-containing protein [Variovorax saccharolyticus]|uniref:lipocalin-like domain-containing protein n=1 Tax=Variovorax saccharolyticus TaxID=3053516 RepID=UPI0025752BE5|nr:lipocalin-like domain-containing protein [Variovorax sp. J31P216]MDM0028893.1 lipocalin-like domain-containing protein [Variovorax sp. J31P216]